MTLFPVVLFLQMYYFGGWFKPLPQAPLFWAKPGRRRLKRAVHLPDSLAGLHSWHHLVSQIFVTAVENKVYMYKLGQGTQCTKCWSLVMPCRFCPCSTNTGTRMNWYRVPSTVWWIKSTDADNKSSQRLILSCSHTGTTARSVQSS